MPGHRYLKWYQFEEPLMFVCRQKNQLHPLSFPGEITTILQLVILGTLGMPGYAHPKWYYELVEKPCVYQQGKNQLQAFLEILQRYANFLFWVLWACLPTHTQNDSNNF